MTMMFRPFRGCVFRWSLDPMADAMGYRSIAAPRLYSSTHSKQSRKILTGNPRHLAHLPAMKRSQTRGRFDHARRLISLPAKRDRRQVGTVSLNHQAFQRQLAGNLAQVFSFLESQIAGKRDIKAQVDRRLGHLQTTAKAMQHPGAFITR